MTAQQSDARPEAPPRSVGAAVAVAAATVLGWALILGGIVSAGLAATGALAHPVPVSLAAGAPAVTELVLPCVDGEIVPGDGCGPSAASSEWPAALSLPVHRAGGFSAESTGLSPVLSVLAAAPVWAGLAVAGVVVLLLVPVLRSTATGRPARHGTARPLGVAAAVVAVGWAVSTVAPRLVAPAVLEHLVAVGGGGDTEPHGIPAGWLEPALHVVWWPVLVVALLGALAAASARGERLAADSAGLV